MTILHGCMEIPDDYGWITIEPSTTNDPYVHIRKPDSKKKHAHTIPNAHHAQTYPVPSELLPPEMVMLHHETSMRTQKYVDTKTRKQDWFDGCLTHPRKWCQTHMFACATRAHQQLSSVAHIMYEHAR